MSERALQELNEWLMQAKLPPEDRVAQGSEEMCREDVTDEEGYSWTCTKRKDHAGDHVAHGLSSVIMRWKKEVQDAG